MTREVLFTRHVIGKSGREYWLLAVLMGGLAWVATIDTWATEPGGVQPIDADGDPVAPATAEVSRLPNLAEVVMAAHRAADAWAAKVAEQ